MADDEPQPQFQLQLQLQSEPEPEPQPEDDEGRLRDYADRAIGEVLVRPDNLREFLGLAAPDLAGRFVYEALEVLPRARLLEDWKRFQCDVLVRMPVVGAASNALVCLLAEHQSAPDQAMPLRSLFYAVLHWIDQWRAWLAKGKGRGRLVLDPIFAVIFYTGPRPWTAQRTMADLIRVVPGLRLFVPIWEPAFLDLNKYSVEELLASPQAFLKALAVVRADRPGAAGFREAAQKATRGLASLYNVNRVRWYELTKFVAGWGRHRRPRAEVAALIADARASQTETQAQQEVNSMFITGAQEDELRVARQMASLVLSSRFGEAATKADRETIAMVDDFTLLTRLVQLASTASSIEEVRVVLATETALAPAQ